MRSRELDDLLLAVAMLALGTVTLVIVVADRFIAPLSLLVVAVFLSGAILTGRQVSAWRRRRS